MCKWTYNGQITSDPIGLTILTKTNFHTIIKFEFEPNSIPQASSWREGFPSLLTHNYTPFWSYP